MKYIYLFPDEPAMGNYQSECRRFGCEYLGKNRFQGERNLVIRGQLSDLKRYAKWLDYELHPDYLYREDDFAGDISDACKDVDTWKIANQIWEKIKNLPRPDLKIDEEINKFNLSLNEASEVNSILNKKMKYKYDACKDETPYQKQEESLHKELKKMDSIHRAIKAYKKFKKDALVKVPENIKREFEQVLTSNGLFKIVSKSPNIFSDTHYQIISTKQYLASDFDRIVKQMTSLIQKFEDKYHQPGARHSDVPVTWSFGYQKDGYISAGIDLDKMWVEDSVKDSKVKDSVKDASLSWNTAGENQLAKLLAKKYGLRYMQTSDISCVYYGTREQLEKLIDNEFSRADKEYAKSEIQDFVKDDVVKTPRGTFPLVLESEESLRKRGYGFHHLSEDGKYKIMTNHKTNSAVAIKAKDDLVKDSLYIWIADPDDHVEAQKIETAKKLGCKTERIGGLIKVIGTLQALAKALGANEKDLLEAANKPMSTIRSKDAVSLRKGDWFIKNNLIRRNFADIHLYKVIDDKFQERNGFAESLLAEEYFLDTIDLRYGDSAKLQKRGTTTLSKRNIEDITVFNSVEEAFKWLKTRVAAIKSVSEK